MEQCAGLIFDDSPHYIDHLAPFCAQFPCPLIVTEPSIATACRAHYPHLTIIERDLFNLNTTLPETIITCAPRLLVQQALPFVTPRKILWLPHGHSDKGWKSPFFEALGQEHLLFVYGDRMKEVLTLKNRPLPTQTIGAYRYNYYLKHRSFYEQHLTSLFGSKRFILYAPSWEDSEDSGTFWDTFPFSVPPSLHLVIKLHPNTIQKFLPEIERCKARVSSNITFIEDYPPIYPLLSRADFYIGDRSSIGYDFLHFNKPLFFLTRQPTDPQTDPSAYLMRCGEQVLCKDFPKLLASLPTYEHSKHHKQAIDELRRYTFSTRAPL